MIKSVLSINQKYEVNGGSDSYYFNLNKLLQEKGIEVFEFASKGRDLESSEYSIYFPENVDFKDRTLSSLIKYIYNYDARKMLVNLLQNITPDLAHLQIYYGQLTPSILKPLIDREIPIIQTLHEYKLSCPVYTHYVDGEICEKCIDGSKLNVIKNRCKDNSVINSSIRYLEYSLSRIFGDIRLINKFICVSRFQYELMKKAGVPDHKLDVVYNFVESNDEIINSSKSNYIIYYGRLEKLKGVQTLIAAMKNFPTLKLLIVGSGGYKCDLERLVNQECLKNVTFIEFMPFIELRKLIVDSLAVVVPSEWYENCSMCVIEAKSLGKPVIASSIGGITEQIHHGVDGYLFKPGSIVSLSNALEKLLSNENYMEMCKESNKDQIVRYSKEAHYSELAKIYTEVTDDCSNR